jgi:hypothetical protein
VHQGDGGILFQRDFDAGLDFAQAHLGELQIGVVDGLEPGEHGAMEPGHHQWCCR